MILGENEDAGVLNYDDDNDDIMITSNLGGLTALALPAAWTTERWSWRTKKMWKNAQKCRNQKNVTNIWQQNFENHSNYASKPRIGLSKTCFWPGESRSPCWLSERKKQKIAHKKKLHEPGRYLSPCCLSEPSSLWWLQPSWTHSLASDYQGNVLWQLQYCN